MEGRFEGRNELLEEDEEEEEVDEEEEEEEDTGLRTIDMFKLETGKRLLMLTKLADGCIKLQFNLGVQIPLEEQTLVFMLKSVALFKSAYEDKEDETAFLAFDCRE